MGQRYQFFCRKCKYRATVSGGPDAGLTMGTITIYCKRCRSLQDCVVRELWKNQELGYPFYCEVQHSHPVVRWEWKPSPCPRCGGEFERDSDYIHWD